MRRIIFKDSKAADRGRRSLSAREVFNHDGYLCATERKTILRLKDSYSFESKDLANRWIREKITDPCKLRRLSMLSVYNSKTGENRWQYKLTGTIYLIHGNMVSTVLFMQIFKAAVEKVS